jgi:single-strand DNA-binding protein
MSRSLNKVLLAGLVSSNPESKSWEGGRVLSFTLKTSEFWNDKNSGETKEKSESHRVVVFNDKIIDKWQSELVQNARVFVEGQLQTRKWKDNNGVEKYITEVVVPRFGGDIFVSGVDESAGTTQPYSKPSYQKPSYKKNDYNVDDEIPF